MNSPTASELPGGGLTFTGTLRAAWRLYTARPGNLIALFAAATLLAVAGRIGGSFLAGVASGNPNVAVGIFLFVPVTLYVVIGTIACVLAGLAMANRLASLNPSIGYAGRSITGSWRDVFATSLFAAVIALCFTALIPLTPLFIAVFYGPVIAAHTVAFEGLNLQNALSRMRFLLAGVWARVLLNLFTVALAIGLADYTLRTWVYQATDGATEFIRFIAVVASETVVVAVLGPLYAAVLLVVYLDVRVKTEGLTQAELSRERAPAA